jgi:hypothetical protein
MTNFTKKINSAECLTGSLPTLNENFVNLQNEACNLKQLIENNKQIRTFFYYGNMQDNTTSKPSNMTIEIFVNSPSQLNLPSISYTGDIVNVIYQKTGFQLNNFVSLNPVTVQNIPTSTINSDLVTQFAPIFIIWQLTFNGSDYKVDIGFPKYSQASTSASGALQPNWNNPRQWSTY